MSISPQKKVDHIFTLIYGVSITKAVKFLEVGSATNGASLSSLFWILGVG